MYIISTSIIIVLFLISALIWVETRNTTIVRIKKGQVMEFKSSMDLAGLPIITFHQGKSKYNFLIDSGSSNTFINASVPIEHSALKGTGQFFGSSGKIEDVNVYDISLYYRDHKYDHIFRAADLDNAFKELKNRWGVQVHGIIGCDFMNKYKYCIDFKENVVYIRK